MKKIPLTTCISILVIGWFCAFGTVQARAANPFAEIKPGQWKEAMVISGFDSELLYAIALVESGTSFDGMRPYGPWPWVMNVNREPRFFATRTAAREALQRELEAKNDRVAVGMFQIYLKYNAKYAKDPIDLIDPVVNMYAGAMVLRDCGKTYDTTETILSCYHSGDVDRAGRAYAERVIRYAEKWGKPFRMSVRPKEVRYSRDLNTIREKPQMISRVDMGAGQISESIKTGEPKSLSFVGSIRSQVEIASHEEFRKRIGKRQSTPVRRVIVVE